MDGCMDGWTKPMFVSHGEIVDGGINAFLSQQLSFLKIKFQIDIEDHVR